MLSRTFTKEQLQIHQLRHKQLPPQVNFSIMKDDQLKPVHYLVKHEEIKYNQKTDCHPILADYGEDQFSIRRNNKGEDIHIKNLDSFSFQSIVPFESKFKRPTKNKTKSLLQQSTILNDTDILSDEDETNHSQDTKDQNTTTLKEQTFAIQYPTKFDYCNQQVPFFDPSYLEYKKYFNYFFLPENTPITIETIKSQQKHDPILQKIYHWLQNKERPSQIDQTIASNSFLSVYYKLFHQLYINHKIKIIHIHYSDIHDSNYNQNDKICLPFKLFHASFNKLHAHGHSRLKISVKAFNQFYFIPFLNKWMSIFIHDCFECQQNKHNNQKIQTATIQTFSENASYFNYRISMDTKGPLNPPFNQDSYIHVIVDAFSHFVVTVPIKQKNAQNAVNSLLHHWITKFGPPVYLVTDRGSEYINSELAKLCTIMGIRHSPRTPYAPWTNGLVENQIKNLGTHLRLFLHNTPENWSTQVHMHAYAHNSQPLSVLNLSPYEIVSYTIPRIPIIFELNLQRDTYRNGTSQLCQNLPLHTHYDKSNLNPFFHKILSKPIPQWILATETAMIQFYHTVFDNTKRKINSFAFFNKTYNNQRSLDIGILY